MKQPLIRSFRSLGLSIALAAPILGYAPAVLACACCSEPADRYVNTEVLDAQHRNEIGKLRFAKPARLAVGVRDEDKLIPGVEDAGEDYQLEVKRTEQHMAFSFRDQKNRSGTLSFLMPNTIERFEVDPRSTKTDDNLQPTLYIEWRLTADASGDGLFNAAVDPNTEIMLVLHGRGNRCPSAENFSHWTLQVGGPLLDGPFSTLTFFGTLESAER
jgi:hypothetical protein